MLVLRSSSWSLRHTIELGMFVNTQEDTKQNLREERKQHSWLGFYGTVWYGVVWYGIEMVPYGEV